MVTLRDKFIILWMAAIIAISANIAEAQYYYINTYLSGNNGEMKNAILKIDVDQKRIVDSLMLNAKGEFVYKSPRNMRFNGHNEIMMTLIVNGISGKNSNGGNNPTTHYIIINKQNFNILGQDSIPSLMASEIDEMNRDTILISMFNLQIGWQKIKFILNLNSNRFREISRRNFDAGRADYPIIGPFINPIQICNMNNIAYYYDLTNNGEIVIFASDTLNNIMFQRNVGDITKEAVLAGCSSLNNLLYSMTFKYKILSFFPPDTFDDSIHNEIIRIRSNNFQVIDTIAIDLGEANFPNEYGQADGIGNYLIYYFAKGDCGDCFDPAYLLIFDTRTNEATWLRVGWR